MINTLAVILGNGWYFQNERNEDVNYSYGTPRFISQLEIEFKDGTRNIILSDESWKTSLGPIIHNGVFSGEIYDARLEQKGWNKNGFDDSKWENALIIRPPEGRLVSQMSSPDRITGIIKPKSITNPKKNIYRFDLGQMISGWAKIKVQGPAGTRIEMSFIEEMGPGYSQKDTYILKGGEVETWEPRFTWHAFRYVDVNSSIPLDLESLEGIVVNTDVESSGEFQCSYPLFNRINDNFRRTQLGNMHGGVPSDCPHRERRGYTGDGQIAADAAIYNFDMAAFYTKWLNDIADSQNSKTGYIPNTVPYQGGGGGTPWGSAYVIIPWYMYLYYGDIRVLEQNYQGMKKWIDFLNHQTDKEGIIQEKNLGEWVPPVKTEIPANLVSTAYYFHCLKLMSEIALVLKYNTDSDYFNTLAKKTKLAFNEKYFNKETMSYSIGWQGANVFPLGFKMVPEEYEKQVFETLVKHIEYETNGHFDTGMMGTPLLLKVLSNFNRPDLAFTLMSQRDFPSFGYQIDKGATTIWETWRGDASHSHPMFGGVCQWFFSSVAGINPDPNQPGFKHIILKPQPVVNLYNIKAVYQSMQGEIESSWKVVGNEFILNVSIPANTTATVLIPAKTPEDIKATAKGSKTHAEITFIGLENNLASYSISSGKYEFTAKNARDLFLESMLTAPRIIPPDTILQMPDSLEVEIRTDHEGAIIRYTLNGMEPDINSTEYLGTLTISKSTTVKARVFKSGMKPSPIKSSTLTFINPEENGVQYEYYLGEWEEIPDMQTLTPFATGKLQDINLDYLDLNKDKFALLLKAQINILEEGSYTFFLNSNDGSKLYIDDKLIIDNDGPHGAIEKQGSTLLSKGKHSFVIHYFQAGGGYLLESSVSGPGISKSRIPPSMLLLDN